MGSCWWSPRLGLIAVSFPALILGTYRGTVCKVQYHTVPERPNTSLHSYPLTAHCSWSLSHPETRAVLSLCTKIPNRILPQEIEAEELDLRTARQTFL